MDLPIIDDFLKDATINVANNIEINNIEIIIRLDHSVINNELISAINKITEKHGTTWYIILDSRKICISRAANIERTT